MGKWWGILALVAALATAGLLTTAAIERRQVELAAPLWPDAPQTGDAQTAISANDPKPQTPPAGHGAPAPPTDSSAKAEAADTAPPTPILLAVDPRTGLAVLQSPDTTTHTLAQGNQLPASHWQLQDIGPDFVELSGSHNGSRQRLRLYRQDLNRPHRLITDRVVQPVVERMILLPLQPVQATTAPPREAQP